MRIRQLRFKNLNSLVGEWSVDLAHPAFVSDGIFAITGPTGAGKTTILDAICLALYASTPRLSKVSAGSNEIMSRQTGECFAEVVFETQAGRYRAHWSQHRARRKAGGALQGPRHELAHADSGALIETKASEVPGQVEALTGMDFQRFTRSMLLAQGDFAAFLDAKPDERAPILEQITGTEIYSLISQKVHERQRDERQRLETLNAELAGLQLLSEEEEAALQSGLEQMAARETELEREIEAQRSAIAWLDGLARLEEALRKLQTQALDWQARQVAFRPEKERLERATQALELAGEHSALVSRRHQQTTEIGERATYGERIPLQSAAVAKALTDVQTETAALEAAKIEQQKAQVIILQVRELDTQLREKAGPIDAKAASVQTREQALVELRRQHAASGTALEEQARTLAELSAELAATQADAGLVEQLAGIRGRFESTQQLDAQRLAKLEGIEVAEHEAAEAQIGATQAVERLEAERAQLAEADEGLRQRQLGLKDRLQGRETSDWRAELTRLQARGAQLAKAAEAYQSLTQAGLDLAGLDARQTSLAAQTESLAEQHRQAAGQRDALERASELLDTQLALVRRIQDYETARAQLSDGEPCPLCGALEHPFAAGNVPTPDATAEELRRARAEAKRAGEAVAALQVKQAETAKDQEQTAARRQECAERQRTAETALETARADLGIQATEAAWTARLPRLQEETQAQTEHADAVLRDADALEKEITGQRDRLETLRERTAQADRDAQAAAHRQGSAAQTLERLRQEVAALAAQLADALEQAQASVMDYGITALSTEVLGRVLQALTERRDQWTGRKERSLALGQGVARLEQETQHQRVLIERAAGELIQEQAVLAALRQDRDLIAAERVELFGEKEPHVEEARLAETLTAAERRLEAARQAQGEASQLLDRLKHRHAELDASIAERQTELQAAESAFAERLNACRFADEASYLASCLPEDERKRLTEEARHLSQEQIALATQERETRGQLDTERQKAMTDRPRPELQTALEETVAAQRTLNQERGAVEQRLAENASKRQQQQARAQAIEQQRRECARWDLLHDLIGSADGKKYRNFAQGLTFELMVGHANRQLRKMSDRYLLVRDADQPLELSVIDSYQAGEVRSTKNLSGGESFIVSLALALGLSQMSSQNVRVDSLFLDEGFGTLDEEALDTALETLAGLQQDGKLIGIISHVAALKERIGTQIQVIPKTGGRSGLQGPGCGQAS